MRTRETDRSSTTRQQKQGPQRPHKLSSKNHLKLKTHNDTEHFHLCNHQKWLLYQNLGGKTVERPNRSTNNGEMAEKAKRNVTSI